MSVAGNVLNFVSRRNSSGLASPAQWLVDYFGGWGTASGKAINPETAKRVSAFYACVSILAETTACLPLMTYKRLKAGGKERADSLDVYSILHDAPNPEQTPFEFKEMLVGHVAMRGNFYARKAVDNNGRLQALWPLHPDRVKPYRNENGSVIYDYSPADGPVQKLVRDQVFHVRNSASDGLCGDSIVAYMSESLGLSLASEEFGARFFANDATPSGVLQAPKKLSDVAYNRLKADWQQQRQGSGNAHKFAILEEDLKWQQIGITAKDAQLLELRAFTVRDIARFFRIPLHMLQETEKVTSWGSGIEQMGIGFVVYTLMPWLTRIEQAAERDLLTPTERKRHYVKFLIMALLRGDTKTRYDAYAIAKQWGWLNSDEIREFEDMNPIPEGKGQEYLTPMNMLAAGEPRPSDPTPGGDPNL